MLQYAQLNFNFHAVSIDPIKSHEDGSVEPIEIIFIYFKADYVYNAQFTPSALYLKTAIFHVAPSAFGNRSRNIDTWPFD